MVSDKMDDDDILAHATVIRSVRVDEVTSYPADRHAWGEFVFSFSGLIELTVADRHYLTPPNFGIWLPPLVEHVALTRTNTSYCIVDIVPDRCSALPTDVCSLEAGPLIKAILADLVSRGIEHPLDAHDERLVQVLIDQIGRAPRQDTFLPVSNDRFLSDVLAALRRRPGDNRSLREWADAVHCTERTLSRRCRRDLGMSFLEWRQRLRLVEALSMLRDGSKVQAVAHEMGFRTSSAFIAMFQKMTGTTPTEFLKSTPEGRRGRAPSCE